MRAGSAGPIDEPERRWRDVPARHPGKWAAALLLSWFAGDLHHSEVCMFLAPVPGFGLWIR